MMGSEIIVAFNSVNINLVIVKKHYKIHPVQFLDMGYKEKVNQIVNMILV